MKVADIPYDIIHKIEAKYGTLAIPDDNPLMIKLHNALGISHIKRKDAYQSHSYDQKAIELARYGYSADEIAKKIGHNPLTVRKILAHFNIPILERFVGYYQNVYISRMKNLNYWGIEARNFQEAKRRTKGAYVACNKHYYEINSGEKYMVAGNNAEIFVKK